MMPQKYNFANMLYDFFSLLVWRFLLLLWFEGKSFNKKHMRFLLTLLLCCCCPMVYMTFRGSAVNVMYTHS